MNAKNDALLKTEKEKKIWKILKMLKNDMGDETCNYKKQNFMLVTWTLLKKIWKMKKKKQNLKKMSTCSLVEELIFN